jgi:hypothetical protein
MHAREKVFLRGEVGCRSQRDYRVFMRVKLVRSDYPCGLQCFARKC